ncbi:hypothetical protein [Amycolatopsis minnesotensis]|uniref:Uncharacterized protein n=1 Tax=Amycolatopsis minnesotensis TaxID=337894 RepID=A0ABN2SAM3_9PSEU
MNTPLVHLPGSDEDPFVLDTPIHRPAPVPVRMFEQPPAPPVVEFEVDEPVSYRGQGFELDNTVGTGSAPLVFGGLVIGLGCVLAYVLPSPVSPVFITLLVAAFASVVVAVALIRKKVKS